MKRWLIALLLMAAACRTPRASEWPPPRAAEPETRLPQPAGPEQLYTAQNALTDVLSGDLEYIGTGGWPGIERFRACAFRNKRVLVVNAYCSLYEQPAFRLEVYSPEHGRVRIYAETRGTVSAKLRKDYFTFMIEGSPPPATATRLPALDLGMPYDALRRYEQQRYDAFLPSCFAGLQNERQVAGCLGALESRRGEFEAENRAFLDNANNDWYLVVHRLRALATRYGVDPTH